MDEYDYEIPSTKLSRSNSFPNLRNLIIGGCMENYTPPYPRRRANSEVVPTVRNKYLYSCALFMLFYYYNLLLSIII